MFYCRQIYDDDCGFACLKMLLSHFHKSFDYIFLKNPKIKGRYSMFELMSYGNTYGINLKGYGIEPYSLSKCKLPLIALTKENNCEHYVIIDKIKKGKIHITDPKRGKYITTCDEFGLIFQNRILEVEGISKKYNIKKEKIISNVMIFEGLSYFFLQLYGIFLLYYKDCLFNLKNITICLIIYSILYFLVIILRIKSNKNFNQNIIEKKTKNKRIDDEKLTRIFNFKNIYLSIFEKVADFIALFLLFFIILIMQDLFTIYTFIIYGLIVLVIEGIKKLIIHNNQIELEKIQLNIIKEKDNINRLFVFENKIQKKIIKYDIFNHIILFLIIVLYCYFYKTWSLNFILFYFILFSYLKTKIINLLNLKNYYDNYIMEYNFFQSF